MLLDNKPGVLNPLTKMVYESFESLMRSIMFCLPGYIVSFNSSNQLAQVQVGIKKVIVSTGAEVSMPVINNVPVHFPGSNGWYMWHEVQKGDEGMLIFSQRSMDSWIETGKENLPKDLRMFSEKDAVFVPGFRTKPGSIPGFINSGIGMSNYSATSFVHITESEISIKSSVLNVEANTNFTGQVTANGKRIDDTHTHDGSPTAATGPKSPTGVVL